MKTKQARSIVGELRKIPVGHRDAYVASVMPIETLEFAAMLLGMKPVFLLGSGFDDPRWIAGVKRVALDLRLEVIEAAPWNQNPKKLNIPEWYRDLRTRRGRAVYITPLRETATEVRKISSRGWVTPGEEARLLGYPRCCVEDTHRRHNTIDEIFFRMAMLAAKGDEVRARAMILDNVKFHPAEEDREAMRAATEFRPCPFTSVDMCNQCAANEKSPARSLSIRYARLAKDLDPELYDDLKKAADHEQELLLRNSRFL